MSSGAEGTGTTRHEYTIRQFDAGDRSGFLDLYDLVFGGGDREWFAWKFEDNPYHDGVPMYVAESGGEIVGTRPFLAFRMRIGDRIHVAFQGCESMVHPDHRRRGLFTRMTRRAFEYYAERDPSFTFNVPNAISRRGYLKEGCEVVTDLETYYRVQNPVAVADTDGGTSALGRLAWPFARGYLRARSLAVEVPPEVTVVRHVDIPAELLATLYRRRPPEEIHAYRDERFFDYRFGNPEWEYTAYTARLGGTPVAGAVAGTRTHEGTTATQIADVVPLVGDDERDRGLVGIVSEILDDNRRSDVITFRGRAVPDDILRTFGFLGDQSVPLSFVTTPTTLIACPLPVDGDWRIEGRDLRTPSNWRPTFVEHNTS